MVELVLIQNFLVALALGAFIGLEREYARYRKRSKDYAGIRTFPLISLFGALSAYLAEQFSPYILAVSTLLIGGLIIAAYYSISKSGPAHTGATSEMAGLVTFFLGVLAYHNQFVLATILAIAVTLILYLKSFLHHFAKKLQPKEMGDTIKFAIIAFVILPFLPNRGYGLNGWFNPHTFWLLVVFISGISFVGYIMIRWIGNKGIPLLGVMGGIASSTATTSSFADQSKRFQKLYRPLVVGVVLANGVMFIRILIEVFVLNKELFRSLFLPFAILAITTALMGYVLWRKALKAKGQLKLSSPFTILPAVKFAIFFAAVFGIVKIAEMYLSTKGVYAVSLLSGLADVDAITLSLSQLAQKTLAIETARNGIIIASLTNIATKAGIAWWFGGKEFGRIVLGIFAILIILGLGLVFLL